jgi:hypothetical protein
MSEKEEDIDETQIKWFLSTLATQTLMTGIDGSQDDADAPRVDMMTGIEESQDDAEVDADASNHSVSSDGRAPAVTRKTPLGEDSTKKNDRQRVGLGYSAVPAIPPAISLTKIAPELSSTSYSWSNASEALAERRARPPTKEEILGSTCYKSVPDAVKG